MKMSARPDQAGRRSYLGRCQECSRQPVPIKRKQRSSCKAHGRARQPSQAGVSWLYLLRRHLELTRNYCRDTTAKRGHLFILQDGGSHDWQPVWVVLRRPYLTFYKHSDEAEELNNVVNISTVRVDHSSELEEVLEVSGLDLPHKSAS
jgi:hypothetical protein